MRPRISLPTLAVAFSLIATAPQAQNALQPDELMTIADVSDVEVARGGRHAVMRVVLPDLVADTRHESLQVVIRKGEAREVRTLPAAGFASWSADGATLRFVSSQDGASVLRAYDLNTGTSRTLARLPHPPRYLVLSPDGSRVAIVADVAAPPQSWFALPPSPTTAQKPIVMDHANIRDDDGAWLPATVPQLHLVDIASGSSREITLPADVSLEQTETGDGGPPAWSANGHSLYVSVARGRDARANLWNVNRDLLQVDVTTGATKWIAEQPGVERNPSVSLDGRSLAYLRQRGNADAVVFHSELVVRDLKNGRETRPLAGKDVDIDSVAWLPDSRGLVVRYLKRARVTLVTVSLDGRELVVSDEVMFGSSAPRVSSDGTIAFVRSEKAAPPEAVSVGASGTIAQWSEVNGIVRARDLSTVSETEYRSAHVDGRKIHALVACPHGVRDTSALPVVVDLHGGPYSARTFSFNPWREYFVSQGYVVVQPNYRGSWGYGSAFAQLSDRKHYPGWFDAPEAPSEMGLDVAGVLEAVREQRLGDPKRVFLRGVSAGALVTSWTLGRTDGFRAAVAQSWYPGEWSAPTYGWFQIRRYFNGPPWDPAHQPEYWRRQPIMLADRIVTPLLIMNGLSDWVTPEMETEKFYYALRSLGRDVKLVIFPDEIHGLEKHPASGRNSQQMEVSWFRAHDTR